ncbi:shikimate dehydrogenase [Maritimibacter sp. UBA3975]|uniref:shikimate dehydrogenase n=1 Tax=Maritimibacter sp. UBA3975 TaxID=1946833 RepID=UPI000C0A9DCA|nr:shikimate dehydrogenase [Maritimibacter sp. UBA3975]MAM63388.1 shikimate dehydrogenase [Maritimibacter sp.]|tara:strand:- start:92672 stop:93484 length:813 start_codon:yes stop_codon:yes gene_type:complete
MTDRYAVFGHPIGHSKSPFIQGEFARQFGEDMTYEAIEAPLDGFAGALRAFIDTGGIGANVTVPFKLEAFELADHSKDAARICGASNTLRIVGGQIEADNTDGVGLVRDITENLGIPLSGARVLFAGAGGATRGAVAPFLATGADVTIANRSVGKATAIVDLLGDRGPLRAVSYDDLTGFYDIVLNATTLSLTGDAPPLRPSVFEGARLAYDLVYGKGLTPFLAQAEARGAQVADGVGMLVEQAAEAFTWWRGKRPDTAPVIEAMMIPLT